MIKGNVIKGWITSIIGVLTMFITLLMLFVGEIKFVWEGVAGLCIGTILLMAPVTIEKALMEAIKAWGKRDEGFDGFPGHFGPRYEDKDDNEPSIKDEPK